MDTRKDSFFNKKISLVQSLFVITFVCSLVLLTNISSFLWEHNFYLGMFFNIIFEIAIILTPLFFCIRKSYKLSSFNVNNKISGNTIPIIVFICIFSLATNYVLSNIDSQLNGIVGFNGLFERNYVLNDIESRVYLFYVLIISILSPLYEEVLIRGFLFKNSFTFRNKTTFVLTAFLSSIVFGYMHFEAFCFSKIFAGIVTFLSFYYTGNIFIPIIIHGVNNWTAGLLLFLSFFTGDNKVDVTSNNTNSNFGFGFLYALFFLLLIITFLFIFLSLNCKKKYFDRSIYYNDNRVILKNDVFSSVGLFILLSLIICLGVIL